MNLNDIGMKSFFPNGCYLGINDIMHIIGGTASAENEDTAHYVEIIDAATGGTIERINAPEELRSCGTLEEVQDFARIENGLCVAGLDAHTEGQRTMWTIYAYYPRTTYTITRTTATGTTAGEATSYEYSKIHQKWKMLDL